MQIDDHTRDRRVPIHRGTSVHHDAFFWFIKRIALHHSTRDAAATEVMDNDQDIIDADDTPLDQDDDSWRDLTEEDVEEIRRA